MKISNICLSTICTEVELQVVSIYYLQSLIIQNVRIPCYSELVHSLGIT